MDVNCLKMTHSLFGRWKKKTVVCLLLSKCRYYDIFSMLIILTLVFLNFKRDICISMEITNRLEPREYCISHWETWTRPTVWKLDIKCVTILFYPYIRHLSTEITSSPGMLSGADDTDWATAPRGSSCPSRCPTNTTPTGSQFRALSTPKVPASLSTISRSFLETVYEKNYKSIINVNFSRKNCKTIY